MWSSAGEITWPPLRVREVGAGRQWEPRSAVTRVDALSFTGSTEVGKGFLRYSCLDT
jgi:hypothetical protein